MNNKEFKCNICNKFYASYKSLCEHKKKFHKNISTLILNNNINLSNFKN